MRFQHVSLDDLSGVLPLDKTKDPTLEVDTDPSIVIPTDAVTVEKHCPEFGFPLLPPNLLLQILIMCNLIEICFGIADIKIAIVKMQEINLRIQCFIVHPTFHLDNLPKISYPLKVIIHTISEFPYSALCGVRSQAAPWGVSQGR